MKKIIVGILIFAFILCIQILYINYRLGQQLNRISVQQKDFFREIDRIEFQTEMMSVKLHQALDHSNSPTSEQDFFFTSSETLKTKESLQIAAIN
jgi:uncharacterized protein YxeA